MKDYVYDKLLIYYVYAHDSCVHAHARLIAVHENDVFHDAVLYTSRG
jgi:hypothetical protein